MMLSSNFINKVINKIDSMNVQNLREFILHLKDDREFFNTIFSSMIEGVIVIDSTRNIGYINKSAKTILGIQDGDPLDADVFEYIKNDELRDYIRDSLSKRLRVFDEELKIGYPNVKVLRLNIIPLMREGNITGDIIMLLDITKEKIEQIKLRRAESLAALTTLAAGVAHEIKNPLGSIDIHIQLIERIVEKFDKEQAEKITSLLDIVHEEIDRLNNIVKDFLFTVRPVDLTSEKIDLHNLLNDLTNFMKYEAETKDVEVIFEVPKNLPHIFADSRFIKQVFINIIKNAVEACSEGGKVEISGCEKDNTLEIKISDTGKGIPENNIDKIFEPYFSTKDTGTGLGLTIVYKIIREHGGNIKVDTVEDKGTTFTIILPTDKAPAKRELEYNG